MDYSYHRVRRGMDDRAWLDEYQGEVRHTLSAFRSVSQIDLVPSLALLLGIPVPFSSLGTVIPELFFLEDRDDVFGRNHSHASSYGTAGREWIQLRRFTMLNQALGANSVQIWSYLNVLNGAGRDGGANSEVNGFSVFPRERIAHLAQLFRRARRAHEAALLSANTTTRFVHRGRDTIPVALLLRRASLAHSLYLDFLSESAALCRSQWTRFDWRAMGGGLALLLFAIFVNAVPLLRTVSVRPAAERCEGDVNMFDMYDRNNRFTGPGAARTAAGATGTSTRVTRRPFKPDDDKTLRNRRREDAGNEAKVSRRGEDNNTPRGDPTGNTCNAPFRWDVAYIAGKGHKTVTLLQPWFVTLLLVAGVVGGAVAGSNSYAEVEPEAFQVRRRNLLHVRSVVLGSHCPSPARSRS